MCVVFVCEKSIPPKSFLTRAAQQNDDGAGIAVVRAGRVQVYRSLDADEIIERAIRASAPALVHFRLASAGRVCTELCHPFPVTSSGLDSSNYIANKVLVHNGHLASWQEILVSYALTAGPKNLAGPWSDSRLLAALLARLPEHIVQPLMNSSGRVATLDGRGGIKLFGYWPSHPPKLGAGWRASNYSFLSTRAEVCSAAPGSFRGHLEWGRFVREE